MKIALVGAKGMLASVLIRRAPEAWQIASYDLPELDLTDRDAVLRTVAAARPDAVINCAAFTDVDGCEAKEELATAVNGRGPGHLAEAAAAVGAALLHISTDYVFDGAKSTPYEEDDEPNPQSAYGRSKLLGEAEVVRAAPARWYIVRTSWLYGPNGKNFVETIARLAAEREELRVVADQVGCPTYTADLADAIVTLVSPRVTAPLSSVPSGLYHFSNEGTVSWHGLAEAVIAGLRHRGISLKVRDLRAITTPEYPLPAPRPAYSVLSKEKYRRFTGAPVAPWEEALNRYLDARDPGS